MRYAVANTTNYVTDDTNVSICGGNSAIRPVDAKYLTRSCGLRETFGGWIANSLHYKGFFSFVVFLRLFHGLRCKSLAGNGFCVNFEFWGRFKGVWRVCGV
ncbi:hypothetical protein PSAB6_100026 [Paraburkholderia sabiae]|nr:hypothetical protein PSAB6_100026 [Paraburkholderia sabiae]